MPNRDEVVLPAYTCPSLARVSLDLGLKPRLVDISARNFAIQEEHLPALLGRQTLAVVHVHPFGIPLPLDSLIRQVHAIGAVVIEDAAQAMGARLNERPVGVRGDFGLYSLGPGKPISAGGGGVLSVNHRSFLELADNAWQRLTVPTGLASAAAMGRLAAFTAAFHPRGWWLATLAGLHRIGDREESWGYVVHDLTPSQAAVASTLLQRIDAINAHRRRTAQGLCAELQGFSWLHLPRPIEGAEAIYLRLPVILSTAQLREAAHDLLWSRGIGAGRLYRHTLAQIYPQLAERHYPGADAVATRLLTLPTHHYLTAKEVGAILDAFQELDKGQWS
jgi:dTDP-4-amino-4,6-dideoxygalactose transaminase